MGRSIPAPAHGSENGFLHACTRVRVYIRRLRCRGFPVAAAAGGTNLFRGLQPALDRKNKKVGVAASCARRSGQESPR